MKFDELAEVYTSMTLRSLGFSLMGVFVPVYLYTTGVNLETLFFMFGMFFLMRVPMSFFIARLVGRIGPKHSMAVSTLLLIVFLLVLLTYQQFGWPLLFLMFLFTTSNGLFFISTHIDFSKIKHARHGGKELGWLFIFERVGSAIGPVLGGIIASLFAPEATIVCAIAVLSVSVVPLFFSKEPVKTHQNITFNGFKNRNHVRDFVSLSSFNVVNVANGFIWPLLLVSFILVDDTYVKLGALVGLSMAISLVSARMFGGFIDNKKGGSLLRYGAVMNVVLQIGRSITTTLGGATVVSALGEPVNLMQKMPLVKGFYDTADDSEKYRIVYIVWAEVWVGIIKAGYLFTLYMLSRFHDPITVMRVSFVCVGFIGLVTLVERFPALKRV